MKKKKKFEKEKLNDSIHMAGTVLSNIRWGISKELNENKLIDNEKIMFAEKYN